MIWYWKILENIDFPKYFEKFIDLISLENGSKEYAALSLSKKDLFKHKDVS